MPDDRRTVVLDAIRAAREGRDRWREVAPLVREARHRGVTFREIAQHTGVSTATLHRLALRPFGTTRN